MKLSDFYRFDAEAFLKSRKEWLKDRAELQKELDNITMLPSVNNESGVRGSDVSDATGRLALARMGLLEKIEEIDKLEYAYAKVISELSEDELTILKGFFEPKIPVYVFVDKYSEEHCTCRSMVYTARRNMLSRVAEIVKSI